MTPTEPTALLDTAAPATLTLYREDGEAIVSPIWFRVEDGHLEWVIAAADAKLAHLRRDPRCVVLVFEAVRPFRGLSIRGRATILPDDGARVRLAIATRYLGPTDGARYADVARRPPGFVLRLPLAGARTWDLRRSLPDAT